MGSRRAAVAVAGVLAALLTALAGCASIPRSGPVVAGPTLEGEMDPGLRFQPLSPAAGAPPSSILRGFLLAASGVEEDHSLARAYLSPRSAREWQSAAGTTVYETTSAALVVAQGGRPLADGEQPAADGGDVTATLTVTVLATLDGGGRFSAAPPGTREEFAYALDRVDGQWRIAGLPEGLLIDQAGFDLAFSGYHLYFPDPTSSFLVPELRWFADRRSVATTLATELLRGPSAWLADAVSTGFPAGTRLTLPAAVTVVDGEARVDLTRTALQATAPQRALMQAQMQATLRPVRSIATVRMTVEEGQLVLPGTVPPLVRDPGVSPEPVAVAGGTLVELQNGGLTAVPDLPPLEDLDVSRPAKGPASYAVLAAGGSRLLHVVPGAQSAPEPLLDGEDLTAPSIDPLSWVWSTAAASTGAVTAARAGVGVVQVDAGWLDGRRVTSLRVSRDGTRALVVSTGAGGDGAVDLAGVVRDAEGRPLALARAGERSVVPGLPDVVEAVWVGETTAAVLGRGPEDTGNRVYLAELPGPATAVAPVPAVSETLDVAAGDGARSLVAVTADGRLWQRAGAQWVQVEAEQPVSDPAFAG